MQFLAWYEFGALGYKDLYMACVGYGPYIEIWSGYEVRDLYWIETHVNKGIPKPYLKIEEVAELTPDSFRTRMIVLSSNRCFELNYEAIRSKTLGVNPIELKPTHTLDPTLIPFFLRDEYEID